MELSPARQKLLFVVIVVALAALGYSLLLPALRSTPRAAAAAESPPPPTAPASPTVVASTPSDTESPDGEQVNIYAWLPFTEQDLAAAAAVTTRFSVDYDTYTYTESASTYIGTMNALIAPELAQTLEEGYTTPGVKSLRSQQKWISSATASIEQLRAFGSSSLTFVVTIDQHLVSDKGTTSSPNQYAVTVTGSGINWQVNDIELATQGNT